LGISSVFRMPRVFFVRSDRTQLLQLQRDRFLHNWRKVGDDDQYPRFEKMLTTFEGSFSAFRDFVTTRGLGEVRPNQCEITYINQVVLRAGESFYSGLQRIFDTVVKSPQTTILGVPDDARLLLRYVLVNEDDAPIGRLIVAAEPAKRLDGANIIQLVLTARGSPTTPELEAVSQFFQFGRRCIVTTFAEITAPAMHREWGRRP
jgi:uncharacterized protein (TIGR04255 family)